MKYTQPNSLLILFFFVFAFSHKSNYSPSAVQDLSYADYLVGSFIDEMNAYSIDYDWSRRIYLVDYIFLNGPETDVAWDVPGTDFNEPQLAVRTYLRRLKELKVRVEYRNDFELIQCNTQFGNLTGAYITKKVILASGVTHEFTEFLELSGQSKSNIRIRSITSSKHRSLSDFECLRSSERPPAVVEQVEKEKRCVLFEEAESAYNEGRYSEALSLYRQSKSCSKNTPYVEQRIEELSTIERQQSLLDQANQAYAEKNFVKASSLYQTYLNFEGSNNDLVNRQAIIQLLENSKKEIAFEELLEKGEYYMSKNYYGRAITTYQEALEIKPGDTRLPSLLAQAKEKQRGQELITIKQEIAQATTWIRQSKTQEEGLVTLMKHEDSGLLTARQFYLMALVLDSDFKPAKKAFDLNNRECCILAKRFAIKASQLGISQEDSEYLWNDHYNKKSRICN